MCTNVLFCPGWLGHCIQYLLHCTAKLPPPIRRVYLLIGRLTSRQTSRYIWRQNIGLHCKRKTLVDELQLRSQITLAIISYFRNTTTTPDILGRRIAAFGVLRVWNSRGHLKYKCVEQRVRLAYYNFLSWILLRTISSCNVQTARLL